ncbi:MAG: glycosyltransferase family 4 protein [Sulfuricaulis sp.]|nr:glycosyltransferase family 4 protein [Sulfuricaulis sp.]
MKILTFTTLYPNSVKPHHGVFVETRLRHLVASGAVQSLVVAPVPWFPTAHAVFGRYGVNARLARREQRHGLTVLHPRYPVIPKVGMILAPFLLAAAMLPVVRRILAEGYDFDLIDAHYFYPDGVAAVMLARHFGKPVVVTARGTDINLIPQYRWPRKLILWAASRATGIIAVSRALKQALVQMAVTEEKITVLRNGVDLQLFQPMDRAAERHRLGLSRTTLLSVGNLIRSKGHDVAIEALVDLPDVELLIIGDGEDGPALGSLAQALGVANRVRFIGRVRQEDLKAYYTAADALVLPSVREGWTNVLLESMACGTPVIANRVGGTPEIVRRPEAGLLVEERTPVAFSRAVRQLMENYPDRRATRAYAEQFDWDETTQGQVTLFQRLCRHNP